MTRSLEPIRFQRRGRQPLVLPLAVVLASCAFITFAVAAYAAANRTDHHTASRIGVILRHGRWNGESWTLTATRTPNGLCLAFRPEGVTQAASRLPFVSRCSNRVPGTLGRLRRPTRIGTAAISRPARSAPQILIGFGTQRVTSVRAVMPRGGTKVTKTFPGSPSTTGSARFFLLRLDPTQIPRQLLLVGTTVKVLARIELPSKSNFAFG